MRQLPAVFLIASVAFVAIPAGAAGDVSIDVVLPLTGPAAFVGKLQADALRAYEGVVNRTGGIRGSMLHFTLADDQSSPQIAVQLASQIKAHKPAVMIGSSIVAMCAAMAPLMVPDGPVEFCLSPGFSPKPDGFVFASSNSLEGITPAMLRFFRTRGIERIAFMSATDASAQEADRVTLKYLAVPENAVLKNVAYEHFNNTDLSVSAQVARIKAAAPQAMIAYASGPAFIAIMRTLKDAGLEIPVLTSTANLVPSVLTQNKDILPRELLFNAFAYEAGDLLGRGALRNVAREFIDGCKAAGIEATPVGALAWDPAKLIVGALRALGPNATSEQVRAFLAGTHDVAGVMGIYDFRKHDQHGLSDSAVVIVRWDPARGSEVPVSRLGGVPIAQ